MKPQYGYRRSLGHAGTPILSAPPGLALAPEVDLRPMCPPVYDQGGERSCTGNGLCAQWDISQRRKGVTPAVPSRNFVYFNELRIEHSLPNDAGAEPRHGIMVLTSDGVPAETEWPYIETDFAKQPPPKVYHDALVNKIKGSALLNQDNSYHLRHALTEKIAVGVGFTVYDSFEGDAIAKTGIMAMPNYNSENIVGGHYVCAVGYLLNAVLPRTLANGAVLQKEPVGGYVLCRNSWSAAWGDTGHFYMPFTFFLDKRVSSDNWVILD